MAWGNFGSRFSVEIPTISHERMPKAEGRRQKVWVSKWTMGIQGHLLQSVHLIIKDLQISLPILSAF